jgi:glycosyltransferase involved in cell wall biosynthesis
VKLSLAVIIRDEEETLARILGDSAEFCDELIVVDTGSVGNSRTVAQRSGAIVLDFRWLDDFAAARQQSFDACTGDWIIWLDADDSIPADVRARFVRAKNDLLTPDLDSV